MEGEQGCEWVKDGTCVSARRARWCACWWWRVCYESSVEAGRSIAVEKEMVYEDGGRQKMEVAYGPEDGPEDGCKGLKG